MKWSKPTLTPLVMNAEIGAYQNDFDGDYPPLVKLEERSAKPAGAAERGVVANERRGSVRT